jgi:hypothetical protein
MCYKRWMARHRALCTYLSSGRDLATDKSVDRCRGATGPDAGTTVAEVLVLSRVLDPRSLKAQR